MKEQTLARNLAAFSLGLGLAELLAPRKIARLIGVSEDNERTLQMLGLREIASGLGIMQGKTGYFLWSRVAGDIMDLGLLSAAMRSAQSDKRRLNVAIAAVVGVTILDVVASSLCSRSHSEPGWRISEPEGYRGGISQDEPTALRAAADEAMRDQSGHVWREEMA
jgi:hypothetical protein